MNAPTPASPDPRVSGTPPSAHPPPRWTTLQQDVANVLWASFLAASVASVVFFGVVDPLALADITTPSLDISRMAGYAIGFFFFWGMAISASTLTSFMQRTAVRRNDARRHERPRP